jgi:cardiolipin synthase
MPDWTSPRLIDFGILYLVADWAIRIVMLVYIPQKRSAAAARTWLLLVFLLPLPGLFIYLMIGRIYLPRWRLERHERADKLVRDTVQSIDGPVGEVPEHLRDVAKMVETLGGFPPRSGNRIELLADYHGSIDRLVADIDAARSSVHLLFYIFEPDTTGRRVADALLRARQRGVTCRLLLDDMGSHRGLRDLSPELERAGVQVRRALAATLLRRFRSAARFDLRNHRKIAVMDGTIGHTGSQNVVNPEFVKGFPNEELVARLTGRAVRQLQAVFLEDWFSETGELLTGDDLLPPDFPTDGSSVAQVLPSGPGYPQENARNLIIHLLHEAERYIGITTPYFVPDEAFLNGLYTAVARGVDTHLIVSHAVDQHLTAAAQRSYFDGLLEVGVKVHLYKPRFLHAKYLSIDDQVALIGSINMDIRSFALNEEVGLVVYDPAVARQVRAFQERCIADSITLDAKTWAARPLYQRVLQNTARLCDSLL